MYADTDSRMKMTVTKRPLPKKKSMAILLRRLVRSSVILSWWCLCSGSLGLIGDRYFCRTNYVIVRVDRRQIFLQNKLCYR